jgi:hypothetical protein
MIGYSEEHSLVLLMAPTIEPFMRRALCKFEEYREENNEKHRNANLKAHVFGL